MRRPISLPVALVLATGVAATPARAADAPVDVEQRVPTRPALGGAAASQRVVTPPIEAPRSFDLLGLRWRGADAAIAVRVQRRDGRWSAWRPLPRAEDAAAGPRRGAHVTGPLWTGRAHRYQLRAARLPRDLRAHLVTVPRTAAHADAAAAPPAAAATARPRIVRRAAWDPTGSCQPRRPPAYGRIDFSVVHHTDSLTRYSRAAAPRIVLGICRFHRNANGWWDIGYNLLVDRFGRVYEGRAGGVDAPVIGAHAGGWNGVSTGIAVIGSFAARAPSRAAQDALVDTLAWKLAGAGVPARGTVAQRSPGGAENRWARGVLVRHERIIGHRDAGRTVCPGARLHAMLPRLRARVVARHAIERDLLTSSPVGGVLAPGGPAHLTGRLALADGRRPVGAPLTLQRRDHDAEGWIDLGTVRTGADGVWSATVPMTVNGALRVVDPQRGIAAPPVEVAVAADVTARVRPQALRRGGEVTVRGATSPAKPRVTIVVERRTADGAWRRVRRRVVRTVDGAYAATVRLPTAGVHRFLVGTAADAANAAGAAPVRTARVR